nr:hypothetical protein [Tanacetum cinerariifolium]
IPSPTLPTPPPQQPQDIPSTSQRIESSADTDMEDASNQGRMIADLDRDEGITLMDDEGAEKKAEDAQPSTKLTFYKAFFSSQWKFLIHTILQSMSAKRTSWNEFSTAMASTVICLSTGKGCSKVKTPLFEGMLVAGEPEEQGDADKEYQGNDNDAAQGAGTAVSGDDVHDQSIPSPTLPTPPPQQPQDIPSTSQNQLGNLSTYSTRYTSPTLTQKVFSNMRRVGKGCSGVETPLFEGMLVEEKPKEQGDADEEVQGNDNNVAQGADTAVSGDDVHDQSI